MHVCARDEYWKLINIIIDLKYVQSPVLANKFEYFSNP